MRRSWLNRNIGKDTGRETTKGQVLDHEKKQETVNGWEELAKWRSYKIADFCWALHQGSDGNFLRLLNFLQQEEIMADSEKIPLTSSDSHSLESESSEDPDPAKTKVMHIMTRPLQRIALCN